MKEMYHPQIKVNKAYQLRHAAGQYVLLHMEQSGVPYESPLIINAVGAEIWNGLQMEEGLEEIAEKLSRMYQVPAEEIKEDTEQFIEQLMLKGIVTKG